MGKFLYRLLWVSALLSVSSVYAADELVLAISTTAMANIFTKIKTPYEEKTGVKLRFLGPPEGLGTNEALIAVEKGEAEGGSVGTGWEDIPGIVQENHIQIADFSAYKHRVIGMDKVQFFLNPGIGVTKLNAEQLGGLLTGKITNWSAVGGKSLPVKLIVTPKQPAAGKNVQKRLTNNQPFVSDAISVADIVVMRKTIAETPGGFGFGALSFVDSSVTAVEHPTIGRPLTFFTKGIPSERIQKLLEFVTGEGQKYHAH